MVKRVTREGTPKWPKFNKGVKPDIFKRAAQKMAKILGGVKFQNFGPLYRPKVLLTAAKSGVAQN